MLGMHIGKCNDKEMLQSRIQKQIPERLSHYTNLEALKSILSDQDGKGICLRAFSNRHKNDDQEIRMGEYMLKRIREVLPTSASLLNQFVGYEDSGSISFMEGEVNQHMLKEYGCYRLEFDLRDIGVGLLAGGLIDCEYVSESELEEFADEYCEMISHKFNSIPTSQEKYGKYSPLVFAHLGDFFMMENDIMTKVFGLKEQQWSEEREWRRVLPLNDKAKILYCNKKPYIEYYLDKKYLTGITVVCSPDTKGGAQKDADDISNYISERNYKATVRVEVLEIRGWFFANHFNFSGAQASIARNFDPF